MKSGAFLSGVLQVLVAACARPAPPAPVGWPLQDIVRRHYDQACQDGRAEPGVLLVSELFDTVGLGEELEVKGLRPPTRVRQHPALDFVTRYRARGIDLVASRAGLTGLELYEQTSTPVPGCGTLLLWSRGLSPTVDFEVVGGR